MLVRARLHGVRETGKVLFITLRQGTATAQAVALKGDNKDLFKWATCAFGGLRAGMVGRRLRVAGQICDGLVPVTH